jgi:hypothetical protein
LKRDAAFKEYYEQGLTDPQIAERCGCGKTIVRTWRHRNNLPPNYLRTTPDITPSSGNVFTDLGLPSPPEMEGFTESSDDTATVTSPVGRVMSLDDLLDAMKVDLSLWDVERHVVNKWEVAAVDKETGQSVVTELFQVKAWLKRNRAAQEMSDLVDRLVIRMMQHAPDYPDYAESGISGERFMLEVSPFDLHIGKLGWKPETGENYDSRIAKRVLMAGVEDALHKAAGFAVERILFPVGNDLLHTDTTENTTTGGTRQDVDTRHHKMFVTACEVMVAAIDRLMQVAPVKVLIIPGNHDRANALKLGVVLDAWYRNTERVTVDAGPDLRKYEPYGCNLLGFTHGSEEKHADLPLIMAQERPVEWGKAKHKEWHVGHFHKRKETRFTAGDTHMGVPVRILPSLSGTDAWHAMRGYVKGQRAVESYLWSHDHGYVGHFSSNVY